MLLVLLLVFAERFGLDVVLGAMLAGMVLRSWTRRMKVDVGPLEDKLDAVGYGIFIPVFFVASGMTLDIKSILANPGRLFVFAGLLLVVRGLPSLFVYARTLSTRLRVEMTFITATTLPLLIALAAIGQRDGVMLKSNAAAIVGAGVLSVLIFPAIAAALHRKGKNKIGPSTGEPVPVDGSTGASEPGSQSQAGVKGSLGQDLGLGRHGLDQAGGSTSEDSTSGDS